MWNKFNSLKELRASACFDSAERLFHNFTPLKENRFAVVFSVSLRSILVLRKLREELSNFFLKRLRKYCGTNPSRDLKTIVSVSFWMSSWMVFPHYLCIELSRILLVELLQDAYCLRNLNRDCFDLLCPSCCWFIHQGI